MIEVPAAVGPSYEIDRTGRGLIRVRRRHGKQPIVLLMDDAAAVGVADALVDLVEQRRTQ